jgi:Ca2+-binding RTX toxin-like protein
VPAAHASTARIANGTRVDVSAPGNERNQILVIYAAGPGVYTLTDTAGIDGTGGCSDVNDTTVTCPGVGIGSISINGGGGSDAITLDPASIPATVEGDLRGGTGDDRIVGGQAADSLNGDGDEDLLNGGPGADELRGGSGRDSALYASRAEGITVTIGSGSDNDGGASDQTGAQRDTVRGDVEQLVGGSGPDVILGDSSSETLVGGPGNDAIFGQSGDDRLAGELGDDRVSGGRGSDIVRGDAGSDLLGGGPGDDLLSGGPDDDFLVGKSGSDTLLGKSGLDRIRARDGEFDRAINCGPGVARREGAKRDKRVDPRPRSC